MAAKKKPAPASSDIDAFIGNNMKDKPLPPEALADLVYFAEQAEEGRVISAQAVLRWLEHKHGLKMSRTRLFNEFAKANLAPWFGK